MLQTCETLPSPIAWWLPAGSTQYCSSRGEITDHAQARAPAGTVYPRPLQNGIPQREVQLNRSGVASAWSIV
jgi:hypothetical protein